MSYSNAVGSESVEGKQGVKDDIIERENSLVVFRVGKGSGDGYKRAISGILMVMTVLRISPVSMTIFRMS